MTRPGWVDEEGANFCGVLLSIEESVLASGRVVTAEERFAFAPTATAHEVCFGFVAAGFYDEIRFVRDQLGYPQRRQSAARFDLSVCEIFLQSA